MSPVAFSINTSLIVRASKKIENTSENTSAATESECQCPLSDGIEKLTLSDELHLIESLHKHSEAGSTDYAKFLDVFPKDLQAEVSGLFIESIDQLCLDESEAEQYIMDFIEDDSREEVNAIQDATNISKHDIFDALFEYSGWEIRDLIASEDPDFPHQIEVSYIFYCNIGVEEVIDNLSESSGEEVPEECAPLLGNVLQEIKSRYALQD